MLLLLRLLLALRHNEVAGHAATARVHARRATVDDGAGSAQALGERVRRARREAPEHGLCAVTRLMDELRFGDRAAGGLLVWASRRGDQP